MGRRSSKEALLDAAERVIRRQGMASTTIEAVAAEAGLSKGGLFYHFSSKKDMMLQLMDRYEAKFKALRQELYDSFPEGPNRLLKATILACVKHSARSRTDLSNVLTMLDDVEMRQRVMDMKKRVFAEISAGYEKPERIALAMFAADGLWIMELFSSEPIPEEFEKKIIDELLALIDLHAQTAPVEAGA